MFLEFPYFGVSHPPLTARSDAKQPGNCAVDASRAAMLGTSSGETVCVQGYTLRLQLGQIGPVCILWAQSRYCVVLGAQGIQGHVEGVSQDGLGLIECQGVMRIRWGLCVDCRWSLPPLSCGVLSGLEPGNRKDGGRLRLMFYGPLGCARPP